MTNLEMVAAELDAAKKKHPKFVDCFTRKTPLRADCDLDNARATLRYENGWGTVSFHEVLGCEIEEAVSAYAHGDLAHARQELAQCAAVCVRAMEEVQKEMEKKK